MKSRNGFIGFVVNCIVFEKTPFSLSFLAFRIVVLITIVIRFVRPSADLAGRYGLLVET